MRTVSKTHKTLLTGVAAAALTIGVQTPGLAQGAGESLTRDVITVTARKREETALEVPISVSAFSQDTLDELGVSSNADLSAFVPGFTFENSGVGGFGGRANPQFRFRGVSTQVNTAASRTGAFFWDGAYLSGGVGIIPLIDLEQVEVIKGPQTAFFGRNTFSGAVNYIPAAPTDEWEGRVSAAYTGTTGPADDNTGYNLNGVLSGPITDKLGVRVAISQEERGAYWEYQDGTPLGEEETFGVIGSATYDVTENLQIKYSGFYVDASDTTAYTEFPSNNPTGTCDRVYSGSLVNVVTGAPEGTFSNDLSTASSNFCGNIPDFDEDTIVTPITGNPLPLGDPRNGSTNFFGNFGNDLQGAQTTPSQLSDFIDPPDGLGNTYETYRHHLSFDQEFSNGFSLEAFASIGTYQNWALFDTTYGGSGNFINYAGFLQEIEDTSIEARLVSPSEQRLRYMVGFSYYDLESLLVEIRSGRYNLTSSADPFFTSTESEVWGIFAALDYDVTEELTLSLEGRYQDDTQTIPLADASAATTPTANAVIGEEQSYGEFMPRVILSYQPADLNMNIYGSYSVSYIQGTQTNADGFAAAEPTSGISSDTVGFFTPVQKLEAYELGFKHDLNDMFQYSAALYYMDWENQVQFVLNPQFVPYYQSGDSEYLGIEAEATLNLTDWFTLSGNYNWVDAELKRFAEGGTLAFRLLGAGFVDGDTAVSAAGNTPRYIQEHSGSLSGAFDFSSFTGRETYARIDALFTGAFFVDNLEFNEVDAHTKLNIRAGMEIKEGIVGEVFGTNITDDLSAPTAGGTTGFFSRDFFGQAPRGAEWGIRVRADF